MTDKYDVAAYVWPAYTGNEPRTKMFWPEGIGEWQSVKSAQCKYEGHTWPRKPLWGYVNEADPYVMEMEIAAAADNAVNVFIYDWYWYDNRPFLEDCLNDGFLKAKNNNRMKFYLMWANHNANYVWDKRNSWDSDTVIWEGSVNLEQFKNIAKRITEKYFHNPLYYTIDKKPVFMIYDLSNLSCGLGGMDKVREALDWWNNEVIKSGLDGIHFQLVMYSSSAKLYTGVDSQPVEVSNRLLNEIGIKSITHYQYVHFSIINRDYNEVAADVLDEWARLDNEYDIPYIPHISIGWDNNPRFNGFKKGIIHNSSPENFENMLREAKKYIDSHKQIPLLTINSWNEWTESSYLEPDNIFGYGYLQAVKNVFGF